MYFCADLFEDIISKNFCVENTPEQLFMCDASSGVLVGWLIKEGKVRRKRYFVLTENALNYYKSEDTRQVLAGSIHLNW